MVDIKRSRSEEYARANVRHQVYLQRYSAGVVRRMLALLNRTDAEIIARLKELERGASAQQLEAVQAEIAGLNARLTTELKSRLNDEGTTLATYESEFTARQVTDTLDVQFAGPTLEQVRAAALSRPFQGPHLQFARLDDHTDELGRRRGALIRDTIRRGFLQGDSVNQVVTSLRGTKRLGYRDGLLETSRRTTETIARTALNHTATAAREEVYKVNRAIVSGVQWASVLDARTSAICRARDGVVYPPDKGPRPPAHPNCRSTTIPVFTGDEPIKTFTYSDWLKEQSKAEVEGVLGKQKAALFLKGDLQLDRFVDNTGAEYSLEELRIRDASAFNKAGLDQQ